MNIILSTPTDAAPTAQWHPVMPASGLPRSANVALGFLQGDELALWRADDGTAQAWANRCPHRGLRFTLGRVLDGKLSCAYHGWEYQAGDGRCVGIPAHPQMPAPRNVCATTFKTVEADGMIWVSRGSPDVPPPATDSRFFLRTLAVRAPLAWTDGHLLELGWHAIAPGIVSGELAGIPTVAYLTQAGAALTLVHFGVSGQLGSHAIAHTHTLLRRLRNELETRWTDKGEQA